MFVLFLASKIPYPDVEPIDHQHLEATEDLTVHLLTLEEVKQLLMNNEIMQALNVAPLWRYMAEQKGLLFCGTSKTNDY